ncbi:MAG: tetratricopeptide repeat protein [Deltaproteobacteria bacterium]|nr:tetratricopeptide repeat protein [Deltaproteobacteria bacterium]
MKTMHFRIFFLIAILMAGILSGCAAQEQNLRSQDRYNNFYEPSNKKTLPAMTSDELEKSGDAFLNRGNLPKALVQYEKSLQLKPDNIEVVYKKGMLFVIGGLNQDAIKEFQKVLKEKSGHALAYKGMGQAFFQMKKYDEAEKNFQKAIELDPGLWKVHNFLGIIYDYKEKYHLAIHKYNKAISLKPGEGFLYNNLGASYSLAGEYKKAINAFNKALETKYSKSKTYNNLGMALSKLRRYREALEAFRKGGNEAQAYNNLGCIYLKEKNVEKAITCFEKAIEINPGFYVRASENLIKARTFDELSSDLNIQSYFNDRRLYPPAHPVATDKVKETASPDERVLVEKFEIRREPKNDSIAFKLKLRNIDGRRIEGYTFVVLKPEKESQEPFRVCPETSLKDGRPIFFKKGKFFSIIRFMFICGDFSDIKTNENFKTATIYVYSKTGRLLLEKAYKVK